MRNFLITVLFLLLPFFITCKAQNIQKKDAASSSKEKELQEEIIEKYVYNCADTYPITSPEYQECLDSGLEKDSTIAYLWQQKAMPYFKNMKYEVGMEYVNKAVKFDPQRWQPYRAFIKCIFAKTYRAAIRDFEDCITKYGNNYEMDHTYKFYIALSYLQLNEFEKAEKIFKEDIQHQAEDNWSHHLDLFYYGISKFEQQKWEEAIEQFDNSLEIYPRFSEAKYYKAWCIARLGNTEEAMKLFKESEKDISAGYTINEANANYETYLYQIKQ